MGVGVGAAENSAVLRVGSGASAMSHAGWLDVWTLVLALISREPPVVVILFWLAVAFAVLMIAEGLRASFFPFRSVAPRGARPRSESSYAPQPDSSAAGAGSRAFEAAPVKFAPRPIARNPKRRIVSLRRQSPPKPRINRVSLPVEPPQAGPSEEATAMFEAEQPAELATAQEMENHHHLAALPPDAYAAVQVANMA